MIHYPARHCMIVLIYFPASSQAILSPVSLSLAILDFLAFFQPLFAWLTFIYLAGLSLNVSKMSSRSLLYQVSSLLHTILIPCTISYVTCAYNAAALCVNLDYVISYAEFEMVTHFKTSCKTHVRYKPATEL